MPVTKAIISLAGYGTRFLPATKAVPKEILPIVDVPIVQYLVQEIVDSGIRDIVLVTRGDNHAIEDHFAESPVLEAFLERVGKHELAERIRAVSRLANLIFVRQSSDLPYGNGSPILAAKPLLRPGEAFAYLFGDDIIKASIPGVKQLCDVYNRFEPAGVVAAQVMPESELARYGVIKLKPGSTINQMEYVVEKPSAEEAPSRLVQLGRFVLSYDIVEILHGQQPGKGNELWLADAVRTLAARAVVIAHPIQGKWLTTGDPLRYLQTFIEFALERPDLGADVRAYLRALAL
jgi:UTP--glucose-1-phosphate uridylyltransferase